MLMFYLIVIYANYDSSETKELCEAQSVQPPHVKSTIYYACDSNNHLQANVTIEPKRQAPIITSYICENGSWSFSSQPYSNELCVSLSAPENTTIYYSCDSTRNVQANFTNTSNMTHALTPSQTCMNGVWMNTDQPTNNALSATTPTTSAFQGKSQQESSVTKVKPEVIFLAIYIILSFVLH